MNGLMVIAVLLGLLAAGAAAMAWTGRRPWRLGGLLVLVAVAAFTLHGAGRTSASSFAFNVDIGSSTDPDAIKFDNITVEQTRSHIEAATTEGTPLTFLFGATTDTNLKGLPAFDVAEAEYFETADGGADIAPRLVLVGPSDDVLGEQAEVMVTFKWQDEFDTTPQIAVLFRFEEIDLTQLNPGWTDFPIGITSAVVGIGQGYDEDGKPVEQLMLPVILDPDNARGFFEDAEGVIMEDVFVRNNGVVLAGSVTSGVLYDGAKALGPVSSIALQGGIGDSGVLGSNGPRPGLTLKATVTLADPADEPTPPPPTELAQAGVTVGSVWNGSFKLQGDASYAFELGGAMTVDLDNRPFAFNGSMKVQTIKNTPPTADTTRYTLTAGVTGGTDDEPAVIPSLFGQEWLSLKGARLTFEFDRGAAAGAGVRIDATATAGPVTGTATLKVKKEGQTTTVGFAVTGQGPVSTSALVEALHNADEPAPPLDAANWNVDISNLGFSISASSTPGQASAVTFTASGGAKMFARETADCPSDGFDVGVLFRLQTGASKSFILAAGIPLPGTAGTLNIKELTCGGLDLTVPQLYATMNSSSEKFTQLWSALDQPTVDFFTPLMCADVRKDCPVNLEIEPGLSFLVQAPLDGAVRDALGNIGIKVAEGKKVILKGRLPVLGGTTTDLSVELPTLENADPDAIFKSGQLKLTVGTEVGEDGEDRGLALGFNGAATFRVRRADQTVDNCAGALRFPGNNDCYDEVLFKARASIAVAASPPSAELTLTAQVDQWKQPFGIKGLTVSHAAFTIGVEAKTTTPPTPPQATMGLAAQLAIGPEDQTATDLTFAVKLGVTGTPPMPVLNGFTVGTTRGFTLREVAKAFAPDLSPTQVKAIPDFSLKNLWFAYGVADDPVLCIRQGLYVSAELHLGAAPVSNSGTPSCVPNRRPQPTCDTQSGTCLAGIELSVDGTGLKFVGKFAPFSAGPIHFDGLDIDFLVTLGEQHFYFRAGATLYNPVGYQPGSTDVLGSAYLKVGFSQRLGRFEANVDGCVLLGGTTPAGEGCPGDDSLMKLGVTGSLAFDVLDGKDFLKNATATLKFSGDSKELQQLADDINAKLGELADTAVDTYETTISTIDAWWNDNGEEICGVLHTAACARVALVDPDGSAAQTYINSEITSTDNLISNSIGLNLWCFASRGGFGLQSCLDGYRTLARNQNLTFIANSGGAGYIALHGVDGTGSSPIFVIASDILVPATTFTYPTSGVAPCAVGGELEGNRICDAGPNEVPDVSEVIGDVIYDQLVAIDPAIALYVAHWAPPQGAAGLRFDAIMADIANVLAFDAPDVDTSLVLERMQTLGSRFDTSIPLSVCAASIDYVWPGPDGDVQPLELTAKIDAYGSKVKVPIALTDGHVDTTAVSQQIVGATLNGPLTDLDCPDPTDVDPASPFTMQLAATTITEGSSLSINGTAAAGADVVISWGDGTPNNTVTAADDGTWIASHPYADGPAIRVVEAGSGNDTVAQAVSVVNAAPMITQVDLASEIDEGGEVTLTATVTDAGLLDTQTVVVAWGDGSSTTTALPPGGGALSVSHVYADDDPTATPSDTYAVSITATDRDGAKARTTRPIDVRNVAPQIVDITATIDGVEVTANNDGKLEIPEGHTVQLTGVIQDPGTLDVLRVQVAWGDGTFVPVTVVRDQVDPSVWTFSLTNVFADDDPTATPRDPAELRVFAADDDMVFAEHDDDIATGVELTIVDVAPQVSVDRASTNVQYSDSMTAVTFSASDVIGFIGGGTPRSESLSIATRFRLGSGAWTDGLPTNLSLTAGSCTDAASRQTCTWSVSGRADVAPGTYTIEATITDDDTVRSTVSTTLVVQPEDAAVTFIGPRVVSAPSIANGSVNVEMRAIVRDGSIVSGSTDTLAGDISRATLTFVDRSTGATLCTANVTRTFAGNTTTGVAVCTATIPTAGAGPWTTRVGSIVGGWYLRNASADDVDVVALRPAPAELHGQHFIVAAGGAGTLAPTTGTRVTVGIDHLGYAAKQSRFGGAAELVFVSGGRTYKATVTSVDTLGSLPTGADTRIANVDARVRLVDVTDPKRTVVIGDGLRLQMRYVDWAKISTPDQFAFAIWSNDGQLIAGTSWSGTEMTPAPLAGGQILVV